MKRTKLPNIIIISSFLLLSLLIIIINIFLLKIQNILLIIVIALFILNFVFFIILFVTNRSQTSKASWFLMMATIPFIGIILYLLFGQKYSFIIPLKRYFKWKYKYKYHHESKNVEVCNKSLFFELSKISDNFVNRTDLTFQSDTEFVFDDVFEQIKNAKKYIFLNFYIAKPGEVFDLFKKLLFAKSDEGLEIKLIFDDFGTWQLPKREFKEFRKKGIKMVFFGSVQFPFIGSDNGVRTHRKTIIIDGAVAFVGGVNISDEYVSYSKKYGYWLDLNVKFEGEFVNSLLSLFLLDWEFYTNEKLEKNKYFIDHSKYEYKNQSDVLLIEDGPIIEENLVENSLIAMISNTKKHIAISSPYYVPTEGIKKALEYKLRSGVQVDLYVPGIPDKELTFNATYYSTRELEKLGANIYFMKDTFLHTKMGLFDYKYAYIGTTNIDMRSMNSQFEILIVLDTYKDIQYINNLFSYYKSISIKRNKIKRITKSPINIFFAKFFGPLL